MAQNKRVRISRRLRWWAILFLTATLGCARWEFNERAESPLRPPRMSSRAVVLETCTISQFGNDEITPWDQLWRNLDEQRLPVEQRKLLARNGIRVGTATGQLPPALEEIISSHNSDRVGIVVVNPLFDPGETHVETWRRQVIPGQPCEISVSPPITESEILIQQSDGPPQSEEITHATGAIIVTASPGSDGQIVVTIQPQIRHGADKIEYYADGEVILPRFGPTKLELPQLATDVPLAPGETIVIASPPGMEESVGGHVLSAMRFDGETGRKLVLIRLAQTQIDNSFNYSDH